VQGLKNALGKCEMFCTKSDFCCCTSNVWTLNHTRVFYVRRFGTISIAHLQESLQSLLFKLEADNNRLET
jgi:hypothetical protein